MNVKIAQHLFTILAHSNSLKELSLTNCLLPFPESQASLTSLTDLLTHSRKLQTLNLSSNDLGPDSALHLAQGLMQNSLKGSLRSLNLNSNRLTSKGISLICESLLQHSKLESLFINDNQLDSSAGVGALLA
jgi:Ran GTPase-activating protein (RanGAP) involved in mRNA processing and transport